MRILVVQEADWMAVGPHQSHHLMERLSKKGHEIKVIDFELRWRESDSNEIFSKRKVISNYHKAVDGGGVTIIRPPIIKLPLIDYASLIYYHNKEIKRQIKEFKPDVIVGFGILNANLAIKLGHKYKIPFVYYIIDELHKLVPQKVFQGLAYKIESANMKESDKVISINEGLKDYTVQMGAKKENTDVIRAGVDLELFKNEYREPMRKELGLKDGDVVLFFMGWLYDFSGLKEVALELAKNSETNIKLLILGRGDLWDTLQEIITKNELSNQIIMKEWVPYNDVPKYIMAADICILPAYKNDIMMNIVPIKLYEYMAAGKPVIATRLPGLVKEFGENNGMHFIDNSSETVELAKKMFYSNKIISEGNKSKLFVNKLDWENITSNFEMELNKSVTKNG